MNQDLKIVYEDANQLIISWSQDTIANKYVVLGMDNLFNYYELFKTKSNNILINKDILKDYIKIRVDYCLENKEIDKKICIGSSNLLSIPKEKDNRLVVNCIKSYNGYTISFADKQIYDKYLIYEKKDNKNIFIVETEDFQVTSDVFKSNHCYFVEGYKKTNNGLVFLGKSDDFICKSKTMPKRNLVLSIVVPIYNVEKFLCRCLDSILLSSFKDFELILVNDGSTDKSPLIMDWYAKKYDFVKSIHLKHGGVSIARKEGFKYVKGEFVAFVDSDDMVHPYMYEELYNCVSQNKLDIAIGKTLVKHDIYDLRMYLNVPTDKPYIIYDYQKLFEEKRKSTVNNIYFASICNKIVKTDLIKKHPLPTDNFYEDIAFTPMLYSYIDLFGFASNTYYVWDKRQRKTTGTLSTKEYKKTEVNLHQKYCDALYFPLKNGNQKRLDYMIYDSLKIAYNFIKGVKNIDNYNVYKENLKKWDREFTLRLNPYVLKDREMYSFLNEILK